ncbi:putative membrane protein (plasmid) [Rhizobium freirei PRF 81]|uniref:Putative membrane protein n=1 Tax=Rhizobium freirei PRF 81 TaxID=363754 RepID=N6UYC4_9HYPH|nr:MAPEG family protein [Rhizobium freirei]ENN83867.1 putative membrane protein [Rhizobium freirei PRF 81]
MISLPIASLFVAGFSVALVSLSLPISSRRVKVGDMVGDSSDDLLRRRIRAQGNFIEYVPLSLIGLGFVEAQGAPEWLVWGIGAALAFGRLLHAIGMLQSLASLRGVGMILTYLALLLSAGRLLICL